MERSRLYCMVGLSRMSTTGGRLSGSDADAGVAAGQQRRYAIIGGGFAGVATAWHLLAHASGPVSVHLFDGAGIAGGASGAAAGLLHPYSPKGKVK